MTSYNHANLEPEGFATGASSFYIIKDGFEKATLTAICTVMKHWYLVQHPQGALTLESDNKQSPTSPHVN